MDNNLAIGAAAVSWLWSEYGKEIADSATKSLKQIWNKFQWEIAEKKYRQKLADFYSSTKILGNPNPIDLRKIFTDVYVLDKITAFQRFDINELKNLGYENLIMPSEANNRKPAIEIVEKEKRIFILGKPGSGKTTFMKYLVLLAADGNVNKTPIFITLREWAESGLDINQFIDSQFEICDFPNVRSFTDTILKKGQALVLFDGLDEVNMEGKARTKIIKEITSFSKKYSEVIICLTCRIAATDYSFENFKYVEIADFSEEQQNQFIQKWYENNPQKLDLFNCGFKKITNKRLSDLAKTPLLLALLCLAFDENLSFPNQVTDLYKESIDALLKKWDASRCIKRDDFYKNLSSHRKEQMFEKIAAENFEKSSIFFPKKTLINQINNYIKHLPDYSEFDTPDSEDILKSIEAQYGIFVERAVDIYSFSHLTFQEYFTAKYIVDHALNGTVQRLINTHLFESMWNEVFSQTASLLDPADDFFNLIFCKLNDSISDSPNILSLFNYVSTKKNEEEKNIYLNLILLFTILIFKLDIPISTTDPKLIHSTYKSSYNSFTFGSQNKMILNAKFFANMSNYNQAFTEVIPLISDKSFYKSKFQNANKDIISFDKFITKCMPSFNYSDVSALELNESDIEKISNYFRLYSIIPKWLESSAVQDRQKFTSKILNFYEPK